MANTLFTNVRSYQILLMVSATLLIIWQVTFLTGGSSGDDAGSSSLLSFTLNDGSTVTLPDTSRYTIVIFWKAASERSVRLVNEAATLCHEPGLDTLARFYFVNLLDSLPEARAAVDFDNTNLPFAHTPRGLFLEANPVKSLPSTVVFSPEGQVVEQEEGYQAGSLTKLLTTIEMRSRITGKHGDFRFDFGGKDGE